MDKDIIYNKMEIIERCLMRVREVYEGKPENLKDYTKQDSIVLNIQRAVEATIDIAMHIIAIKRLGIPKSSRDAFEVLAYHGVIDDKILNKLKNMVGFRNIAVHNYQKLNVHILQGIIENNLNDFNEFIYFVNKLS